MLTKFTKITDPAQLNEALDVYEKACQRIPMPSQTAIESVLASSENPKAKTAKWDQFVDDRFVKELLVSGGAKVGAARPLAQHEATHEGGTPTQTQTSQLFQVIGHTHLFAHFPQSLEHGWE